MAMKTVTVEARGEQCPIPVVKTRKVLDGLTESAVVEVHVDNEIAVQNLSRMANYSSLNCESKKIDDAHYVVTILSPEKEKGSSSGESSSSLKEKESARETDGEQEQPPAAGDFVVAVDSDCMGRGSEELGKILLKGFLYALSQLPELPDTILFYNGGARITTEGSDSLEDLRAMEEKGVTIRTCGTCLNYYHLTEKLAVGEVTNMYDIVETLARAGKIVRP